MVVSWLQHHLTNMLDFSVFKIETVIASPAVAMFAKYELCCSREIFPKCISVVPSGKFAILQVITSEKNLQRAKDALGRIECIQNACIITPLELGWKERRRLAMAEGWYA